MNITISLGNFKLKNSVLVASGTFGYAEEFKDLVRLNNLGAIVTKTITLKPRQGNPPPRLIETASGMLNAIGLENQGLENFIKEKLPYLNELDTQIIVSIAAESAKGYEELVKRLEAEGVSAFELNLSCPNIKPQATRPTLWRGCPAPQAKNFRKACSLQSGARSQLIAQDPKATYEVVKAVRKQTRKTIIAKLAPNVTDIVSIAKSAESAGADSISLVNTFLAMSVDVNTRRPKLANITGGLSGPAIKPIALRMVWEVSKAIKIPVIGIGGIMTASDALEFIIAGAQAIQVGTANFVNPKVAIEIIDGIKDYMRRNRISDIKRLIGSLKI